MEDDLYLQTDSGLVELSRSLFKSEDVLQRALAENPRLLAGDDMTPDVPRNWALIARETSVPDKEGGNERWSADHLFVDQDAIPTVVEVKRSEDSRIRRRVVGQVLDYASHARKYWEAGGLQERFEQTHGENVDRVYEGLDVAYLDEGGGRSVGEFWQDVESNLRSGHLRLLFVADKVPRELREVVEYLNEQMRDTEVFAIEVARYEGDGQSAYSPSLYGKTAGGDKGTGSPRSYSTPPSYEGDDFLGDVEAKEDAGDITTEEAEAMREIYRFVREEADSFEFGGSSNVTVKAKWDVTAGSVFSLSSAGGMTVWMADNGFDDDETDERLEAANAWLRRMGELDPDFDYFEDGNEIVNVHPIAKENRIEEFESATREFVARCETALEERQLRD